MRSKELWIVLAVAAATLLLVACPKKERVAVETVAPTAETPAVIEEPAVATPETAGAAPVASPPDVAKVQLLDGLKYTVAVVGWDNPFAATMVGRAIANLDALAPTAEGALKDVIVKAQLDLGGVKTKLDGVVTKKGTLSGAELDVLKDTLHQTHAALAGAFASGGGLSEAEGRKFKEGHRMKEEKRKEGGDAKKEKWAERGKK